MSRIRNEEIEIDYKKVTEFFNERGKNKKLDTLYNYVLFQDDNPNIAIERDKIEKSIISEVIDFKEGQSVLDIGCGVGRWGQYLLDKGLKYTGIDASENLIEIAEKFLSGYVQKKLRVARVQEILNVIDSKKEKYDYIFVNGVFMYLNDSDYYKSLNDILCLCGSKGKIYIKESMALEERLTLDDIYSDSLSQNYSAIYRTINDYRKSTDAVFGNLFALVKEGYLFGEELRNRKETVDYYLIFEKKQDTES